MKKLSRREFLKLAAMLPLAASGAAHVAPLLQQAARGLAGTQNNIMVLVFDALSARNMSLHGYTRQTTPNLAQFAKRANVYHAHYASSTFTSPGTASLLTGVYPWLHRANLMWGRFLKEYSLKNFFSLMPETVHRIAYSHNPWATVLLEQCQTSINSLVDTEELYLSCMGDLRQILPSSFTRSRLYAVLMEREGGAPSSSLFLSLLNKLQNQTCMELLDRRYAADFPVGLPNFSDRSFRLEDAVDWIVAQAETLPQPYLAYYHLFPPHDPYNPRQDFLNMFKDDGYKPPEKAASVFSQGLDQPSTLFYRRRYDEFLAYADAEFGRLIAELERSGALANTTIIVTSDHGEIFERGIRGHSTPSMHLPLLHVPLLIATPGQTEPQDFYTPTSAVDLLPTLLHMHGVTVPDWCEGQVLPGFSAQPADSARPVFALQALSNPQVGPFNKVSLGMVQEQYQLMHYRGYDNSDDFSELYDLQNDPEQFHNLANQKPGLVNDMLAQLNQRIQAAESAEGSAPLTMLSMPRRFFKGI